jgi:hypothetical protein
MTFDRSIGHATHADEVHGVDREILFGTPGF